MKLLSDKTRGIIVLIACVVSSGCGGQVGNDAQPAANGGSSNFQGVGGANLAGADQVTEGSEAAALPYCNGLLAGQRVCMTSFGDWIDPYILLVIDESSSMNDPATAGSLSSKWSELTQALSSVLAGRWVNISRADGDFSVNWALELFPYNPNGIDPNSQNPSILCKMPASQDPFAVGFTPGVENASNIIAKLDAQTSAGSTPTAQALQLAYSYVTSQSSGPSSSYFIVLITDGGPDCNSNLTCNADTCVPNMLTPDAGPAANSCVGAGYNCLDDSAVQGEIEQLAQAGVRTAVIGLPGSEPFADALNRFARAGDWTNPSGNGNDYYAVSAINFRQSLIDTINSALNPILPQRPSCDIQLPSFSDTAQYFVVSDCELVPSIAADTVDAGSDGYFIDFSQVPPHLILQGQYCDQLSSPGLHQLDVIEGCTGLQ